MSLHVDRPDFTLDESDDNFELWTFRLPIRVPTKSLNDIEFNLKDGKPVKFSTADGKEYLLEAGKTGGLDCFRALIRKDEDDKKAKKGDGSDDSGDDDDDGGDDDTEKSKKEYLQPTCKPFVQHFDVVSNFHRMTERQVAPMEGPEPLDKMKHAYAHVPQRTGLIRRWMPPGAPPVHREKKQIDSTPKSDKQTPQSTHTPKQTTTTSKKRQREEEKSTEKSKVDRKSDKKARKDEKKAKKAEKKAMKKDRKSSKKAKKDASNSQDV